VNVQVEEPTYSSELHLSLPKPHQKEKKNYQPERFDDFYLEYYSGKGFYINFSVYISYVKHINSSNKP
jgi:hypothetical protein